MTSPRLPLVKAQRSFLSGIRLSREQHGPKVKITAPPKKKPEVLKWYYANPRVFVIGLYELLGNPCNFLTHRATRVLPFQEKVSKYKIACFFFISTGYFFLLFSLLSVHTLLNKIILSLKSKLKKDTNIYTYICIKTNTHAHKQVNN
jgi:hypothetical protein